MSVVMNFGRKCVGMCVCVCVCVCVCDKAATSHSKINIVKRIAIKKCVL